MTKRDLVVKIARKTRQNQSDVAEAVQLTLDYIAEELIAGRSIELRNFGVFEIKVRKSRKGRNPNEPQNEVVIPERTVVKFRAGKELKEAIEKLFNVEVLKVNTLNAYPKKRRVGRYEGRSNKVKKAIVKLKEGNSIEF